MMHKTIFTIDSFVPAYIGYTDGRRWNGWATPYFEKAEALHVMEDYNKNTDIPMFYNEDYDTFYHFGNDSYDGAMWRGADYNTEDGTKHLYDIGAYCWVWDDVTKNDIRYIAQEVEEFIFYHSTYNHMDEDDHRREEVVNAIIKQFTNLDTLCKAICIIKDEDLTSDERFEKLGGILTL